MIDICFVIPCLNEASNIVRVIDRCIEVSESLELSCEVIVVNDGSTDRTSEVVESLKYPNLRVISNEKNLGVGKSFKLGSEHALADFVVFIPGDGENDPYEISKYLVLKNEVDLIIPFNVNSRSRRLHRRFLSSLFRFIVNMFFGMNFNYTNGTVCYRTSVLNSTQLKSTGFFFQAELILKLVNAGYFYCEVPVVLSKRVSGQTKALTFSSLINVIYAFTIILVSIYHRKLFSNESVKKIVPGSALAKHVELI